LEQELIHHLHHPAVGPLCLPILFRTSALADDLLTLHGTGWQHTLTASIPAQQYAIHLRQLSQQNPHLLVAHAYTRYLGDLAGGQILRAFAKLALGLSDQQGLSFYDFPQIADLAVMRDQYRRILDSLPLTPEQSAAVVTEAVRAFQMNQALLEAVDVSTRSPPGNRSTDQQRVARTCARRSRKSSIVRASPSCSGTLGENPNRRCAKEMSGLRCFGSSNGSGRCTISEREPVSSMTL
jgi:heme oxygenase